MELVRLAEERGLTLMVGSTFLYSAPVRYLREVVQSGYVGQPLYIHSARLNFGLLRQDVDVLWDLAPHDLAIILHVLGEPPVATGARTVNCTNVGVPEVAHVDLRFPQDILAHIHVSWMHPAKVRRLTLVGSERMLVYDDTAAGEAVRIYDRKVTGRPVRGMAGQAVDYSFGDVRIPYLEEAEPLKEQCAHFLHCVRSGEQPLSDGRHGLEVVQILEALGRSATAGGTMEPFERIDLGRYAELRLSSAV
jgi:predicted dehydrogenase